MIISCRGWIGICQLVRNKSSSGTLIFLSKNEVVLFIGIFIILY